MKIESALTNLSKTVYRRKIISEKISYKFIIISSIDLYSHGYIAIKILLAVV
jgi:hypothetical protein